MMDMAHAVVKSVVFSLGMVFSASLVEGASLTAGEIQQIETEFGITLSATDQTNLAAVVKPDAPHSQWRIDADTRIESNRKADLDVQVVDSVGTPVPGAQVAVRLKSNAFKFGGTFSAKDFSGVTLPGTMTTQTYKDRLLSMFNGVGLNNGFKPKLTSIHTYLPGVLEWAQANNLPVRAHLLMWPGGGELADLDDPTVVSGVDYGSHLSGSSTSDYAHYNVLGAVDAYKASARTQSDKDALKAIVDAEVQEWAGRWGVYEWDVINETLGNHLLQDIMGQDQMAEWFKIAESNVVSPDCKLLINDYQIISSMSEDRKAGWYTDRRDRYMTNINQVIADGGRLDRIGFQSRIKQERRDPAILYDRLKEWGDAYGLEMVGTEFEVVSSDPGDWMEYIYTDEERAQITEEMMIQYYSHPLVTGLNAWNTINDDLEALVDYSGNPTRNGLVWYYVHRIRYMTDTNETTDVTGTASARAFKGDYDITVSYNGTDYPATLTLASNQTAVVVLGDVVVDPGPVPVPVWVALEEWTYDGVVDGTALNGTGTESTTGTGLKWNANPLAVISNQMQRWEYDGVKESAFQTPVTAGSSYENAMTGIYQMSYDVVAADFSNTAAANGTAQFGYGIRDNTQAVNGTLLVRYDGSDANNRFQLSLVGGSTVQQTIVNGSSVSSLHVRAVYDLDNAGSAGSFIGYFSIDGGSETAVTNQLSAGFTLETLRMHVQTINGGNSWALGDVVMIDNITLSGRQFAITPESYYTYWLTDYPALGISTNLTDNPDGDLLSNLAEYAMGGDPANGADVGYVPDFQALEAGGTNYFEYVHAQRNDAADRGLIYSLELSTNMVSNVWTNGNVEVVGIGTLDAEFDSVTNRVPTMGEEQGFIRLRVGYQ